MSFIFSSIFRLAIVSQGMVKPATTVAHVRYNGRKASLLAASTSLAKILRKKRLQHDFIALVLVTPQIPLVPLEATRLNRPAKGSPNPQTRTDTPIHMAPRQVAVNVGLLITYTN